MTQQHPQRFLGRSSSLATLLFLLPLHLGMAGANAQQPAKPEASQPDEKAAGQEFSARGQREAREVKYSDWRKFCFKTPGTNTVCRTSIAGTFETGQSAVRVELIEREGEKVARLRLFLPVGLYLQSGVRLTTDQGSTYRVPYIWCLTNTCIAADVADPKMLKEMETSQKLRLEVVDSSVLTVSTSLPLNQFAAVRNGPPAQTFEQAIDE
jgi:invasion protein IalB